MPEVATKQYALDFEPGLTGQFPEFMDCVAASIYGSRSGANAVAIACDVSPGTVSKWLNWREAGEGARHFPMKHLPRVMETTGDYRPVYWLIERFLEDEDAADRRARAELRALLPRLQALAGDG